MTASLWVVIARAPVLADDSTEGNVWRLGDGVPGLARHAAETACCFRGRPTRSRRRAASASGCGEDPAHVPAGRPAIRARPPEKDGGHSHGC